MSNSKEDGRMRVINEFNNNLSIGIDFDLFSEKNGGRFAEVAKKLAITGDTYDLSLPTAVKASDNEKLLKQADGYAEKLGLPRDEFLSLASDVDSEIAAVFSYSCTR